MREGSPLHFITWASLNRGSEALAGTGRPIRRSKNVMKSPTRIVATAGVAVIAAGLAATCAALLRRHPVGNHSVPEPARHVNLELYLGRWFEIARYEQAFEKGCEAVTADYARRADGTILVVNTCRKPGGRTTEARGRAKVVDERTNAKLKVSFFGPFYGDYWVLDRADDYSWSIVGEPSGRYLWILARVAVPPQALVSELIGKVRAMGYDTSVLLRTAQP